MSLAHAVAALAERGISSPSQELLRLQQVIQHLEAAAALASSLGQHELELLVCLPLGRARAQLQLVERHSKIAG